MVIPWNAVVVGVLVLVLANVISHWVIGKIGTVNGS